MLVYVTFPPSVCSETKFLKVVERDLDSHPLDGRQNSPVQL